MTYLQAWLDSPDGGGHFPRQRDAVQAHNQTCSSLRHAWLPRRTGSVCPSDLSECDGDCGVTFFNEGGHTFEDCADAVHWYCACCFAEAEGCPCGSEGDDD